MGGAAATSAASAAQSLPDAGSPSQVPSSTVPPIASPVDVATVATVRLMLRNQAITRRVSGVGSLSRAR